MENISFLAHDIRNIAASISLDAERMSSSTIKSEREMGLRTLQRIERMVTICQTAMTSVQIEPHAAQLATPSKEYRVIDLLLDLVASLPQTTKEINIKLNCDAKITTALCEDRLYRLLYNLMSNATKVLERQDNGALYITVDSNGENLHIDVSDNGPGLPEAIISRFFFPLKSITQRKSVHGYGLRVAKRMADELHGYLALMKSTTCGTHFRVTLPC